jgi:hypothetical protein
VSTNLDNRRGPLFAQTIARAARRPIAWTFGAFAVAGMSLVTSLPVYRWFADTIKNKYEPEALLHHLDVNFRTDNAAGLDQLLRTVGTSADWMMVVAVLIGVFSAGGWLRTLADPDAKGARRLFYAGAARYFWRFLRLAVVVVVLAGILGTLLFHDASIAWQNEVIGGWPGGKSELSDSERSVVWLEWGRNAVHLVCLALLMAWAIFVRTRIVLQNASSVVAAGAKTLWLMVRRPFAFLAPLALLTGLEFLFLLASGGIARLFQSGFETDASLWRVFALFLLGAVVLCIREIFDGARYAAALEASRGHVRATAIDPWSNRIGGPGGPQYPLGTPDDDYSIAV